MWFKTHDHHRLYYELRGNPDGPFILLMNGLTQTTLAWEFVVRNLENNFHIILTDFIFQGNSDEAPQFRTFQEHARDMNDLLNSITKQKVHIGGLSYGSLVAQHYGYQYPEKAASLILMSTFAETNPLFENIGISWKSALHAGGYNLLLDVMLPYVLGKNYFEQPFIPVETLKNLRKEMQPRVSGILKLMQATEERGNFLQELKSINLPALVIHGLHDMLLPVSFGRHVHEALKGSKFIIMEHCGHTLNLEDAGGLAGLIEQFIREC